jgi:polyisoprenoid-binding protein YceI
MRLEYSKNVKFVLFFVIYDSYGIIKKDYTMSMKQLFYFSLLSLSLTLNAGTWKINKDHSEVLFQVPYLGVSELTGRFGEFHGSVEMDEKTGTPLSLVLNINSSSIDTGHKMRDNHLKANDFLGSKAHPEILFKSSSVQKLSPGSFRATGPLSIKGVVKPITIDFTTTESVKDTWGYINKFAKYKAKLNRKDFNINWNKTLEADKYLVGDEVVFWGVFQIQPASAVTPASKHMIPDTKYIRGREEEVRKDEESTISKKLRNLINGK